MLEKHVKLLIIRNHAHLQNLVNLFFDELFQSLMNFKFSLPEWQ